jgi:outer membrane protein assembly factor BamB
MENPTHRYGNSTLYSPIMAPTIDWKFDFGNSNWGGFYVANDTVYIGRKHGLVAISDDGTPLWRINSKINMNSTPAGKNGIVFAGSEKGFYAIDAETSTEQWSSKHGPYSGTSFLVVDDTIFFNVYKKVGEDIDEPIRAVDAATGTEKWSWGPDGRPERYTPAVADGTLFTSRNDTLYALNANTGTLQWEYTNDKEETFTNITVVNGTVFVTGWDGNLWAIDDDTGEKLWIEYTGAENPSAPAVVDGTVYVSTSSVRAIDAKTGYTEWNFYFGRDTNGATVRGDTVYVTTEKDKEDDGNIHAIDATMGYRKWSLQIDPEIENPPVIKDSSMYIYSNGKMIRLSEN